MNSSSTTGDSFHNPSAYIRRRLDPKKARENELKNQSLIIKPMEKQHPRQITGSKTPNNNAADPSFKKSRLKQVRLFDLS